VDTRQENQWGNLYDQLDEDTCVIRYVSVIRLGTSGLCKSKLISKLIR
jgi:hypothetical protein